MFKNEDRGFWAAVFARIRFSQGKVFWRWRAGSSGISAA